MSTFKHTSEHPIIRAHELDGIAKESEIKHLATPFRDGKFQVVFGLKDGELDIDSFEGLYVRREAEQITIHASNHEPFQVEKRWANSDRSELMFRHPASVLLLTHVIEGDWQVGGYDVIISDIGTARNFLNRVGMHGRGSQYAKGVIPLDK